MFVDGVVSVAAAPDGIPHAASGVKQLSSSVVRNRFRRAQAELDRIAVEDAGFGDTVRQGFEVVRQALDRFGPRGLAISFNGGKDACVVFYLLMMVLAERDELELLCDRATAAPASSGSADRRVNEQEKKGIPVVYFEKEEFPEMDDFMRDVAHTLGFEFRKYAMSYREGMEDLVNNENIQAVIMGQRRGDPWTDGMDFFTPSTPGWPEFTRVNPALEWKFHHVWRFLRGAGLSYCCLYDQGYTSLGERGNTAKNDALRLPNGEYRPAYELAEEHLERSPRSAKGGTENSKSESSNPSDSANEPNQDRRRVTAATVAGKPLLNQKQFTSNEKWKSLVEGVDGDEEVGHGSCSGSGERVGVGAKDVMLPEAGACVATGLGADGEERDRASLGWVDGSPRWLPATVVVLVVLASCGLRRAGVPLKGS